MLLFDLTGTGVATESRDDTVSVQHKQTVGEIYCARPLCSHSASMFTLCDDPLLNPAHKQRSQEQRKDMCDERKKENLDTVKEEIPSPSSCTLFLN